MVALRAALQAARVCESQVWGEGGAEGGKVEGVGVVEVVGEMDRDVGNGMMLRPW